VPIDRDRERAKRRYAKRQATLQARAARARRNQQIVGAVVAVLVVAGGVFLMTRLGDDDPGTAAAGSSGASSTATTPGATDAPTSSAKTYASPPPSSLAAGATWDAKVAMSAGDVSLELYGQKAPQTVSSFVFLSREKFYDGTRCHRLTTQGIYVLQCGDPTGTGSGGPGYQYGVENAPKDGAYPAGTLAMARSSDPGSNGSQFFIVYKDSTLAPGYTVFGSITKGLPAIDKVAAGGAEGTTGDGKPKLPVKLTKVLVQN
jgi:peptidyl-prolyl cis-trans isomerase B (cyclophilin B)